LEKDLNRGVITRLTEFSNAIPYKGHAEVGYYWPRASVSNLKEQKCEKDIKLNIGSNDTDINFSVLGKF